MKFKQRKPNRIEELRRLIKRAQAEKIDSDGSAPVELDDLLEWGMHHAVARIRQDRHLNGMATLIGMTPGSHGDLYYHAILMPENEKGKLALAVRESLLRNDCDRYVFFSETWISSKAWDEDVQPREASDRRDGLQITVANRQAVLMANYLLTWDADDEVHLENWKTIDSRAKGGGLAGRCATLLAPEYDPNGYTIRVDERGYYRPIGPKDVRKVFEEATASSADRARAFGRLLRDNPEIAQDFADKMPAMTGALFMAKLDSHIDTLLRGEWPPIPYLK